MLYIRSLTATERGLLQQRQRTVPAQIASRARMILLSADGWSVPAITTLLGCCRRIVRKWLHAFTEHGLAGLVGKPVGRPAHRVQTASSSLLSATSFSSSEPMRLVPVIGLTVPEIRVVTLEGGDKIRGEEVKHEGAREAGAGQPAFVSESELKRVPGGTQWEPSRTAALLLPEL